MDFLSSGGLWSIMVIGGPIALGLAVLAVYLQRRRRQRPVGDGETATRKNWNKEEIH